MGPSLARRRQARRATRPACRAASPPCRASRAPDVAAALERRRRRDRSPATCSTPRSVERLPDAPNVLFLAGMKFGATADPGLTWALNTRRPRARRAPLPRRAHGRLLDRQRLPARRPRLAAAAPSATPPGRSASTPSPASAASGSSSTTRASSGTPCLLFRLFYAVDLRYGTLVDVARRVHAGEPVDLAVPCFNAIWQGDALSYAIRSLALVRVAAAAPQRDRRARDPGARRRRALRPPLRARSPASAARRAALALLGDARECHRLLGPPEVSTDRLVAWVADWVARGGRSLGKPTGFEKSDGRF